MSAVPILHADLCTNNPKAPPKCYVPKGYVNVTRTQLMIKIDTKEGPIFAQAEIRQIPINPLRPPSMEHIDPIRRWQDDAEKVWVNQPWIVASEDGYRVFCIRPTQTRPNLWGTFATLHAAACYVSDPPAPFASTGWLDSNLNF